MTPLSKRTARHFLRIAGVVCVLVATVVLCWPHISKHSPDQNKIVASEDEVYEVVMRDFVPSEARIRIRQLVFNESVLTGLDSTANVEACRKTLREILHLGLRLQVPPIYNSLPDRIYRVFTPKTREAPLRHDTVDDFLHKACSAGHLSTTFNTDLPRHFVSLADIHFETWPVVNDNSPPFESLFPKAGGIISLSHVGFDTSMDQALVYLTFDCGFLCGTGWRYILSNRGGQWEIVAKMMVWVS